MKPHYSESSVQPVSASKLGDNQMIFTYRVPLESMYFSPGVDYQAQAGILRVVIGRCRIRTTCTVMSQHSKLSDDGMAEVHLPYHGEKVVVVHADKEQVVHL
ncbi:MULTISPECIES: hypothetical protein [unclassified Lysobacter]|uniref:hypothetical protein n=1 Tax=unclassified Lysobacter TaxID=2635362 RepID=UPI001BE64F31|nr:MULTISPECIES: hypothetical protein [unclassified Lysobacter]MBT2746989.1 hypothetical protein [Lysobacter sp. ISL-42]MBT2750549.1 hypothetical protein [Lysobacter sp. ISL-50]MBT2776396.1 hypothetical protein [Lysobacter sp. ISL-54]MBT2780890.1 hypothetical protein [Lysobacter sp. ISL-52]